MTDDVMGEPGLIAAAGDWHGNGFWAVRKIRRGCRLLADAGEARPLFLHLGDFGFYPGDYYGRYLAAVSSELAVHDAVMVVIDGNHEDHDWLAGLSAAATAPPPHEIVPRVYWLPRGFRWQWYGRTWLALGGATSVNKVRLTEGWDWFPGEAITPEQGVLAMGPGHADVMVTHDCPAGVHLSLPPPESYWAPEDLAIADAHRGILQSIGEIVKPAYWMHGHYHEAYAKTVTMRWGSVQVTGLAEDGARRNTAILDIRDMAWAPFE